MAPTLFVLDVLRISPQAPDHREHRWYVTVDDGTISTSIEVYVAGSDAGELPLDESWIRQAVQNLPSGRGLHDHPADALQRLSPIQLDPPQLR